MASLNLNARPRTSRGDVSNAEQHPFLRAAVQGGLCTAEYCGTDDDCGVDCHCVQIPHQSNECAVIY